jgi:NADH:ubiquinone oxidoreductase subunit F (NADH-binding)
MTRPPSILVAWLFAAEKAAHGVRDPLQSRVLFVHRIEHGQGRPEDLDLLNSVADNIQGRTICALGDAAAMPVRAFIKHFRSEFEHHVEHKRCLVPEYV